MSSIQDAPPESSGGLRTLVREHLSDAISQLAAGGALIVVFVYLSFASDNFLTSDTCSTSASRRRSRRSSRSA